MLLNKSVFGGEINSETAAAITDTVSISSFFKKSITLLIIGPFTKIYVLSSGRFFDIS